MCPTVAAMPGCPNGADPTPAAAGLQQLLDIASMTASLVTLFRTHSPTSLAGFTASMIDVDSLCQLNPDPPRELTALDFVTSLAYDTPAPQFPPSPLQRWIFEWLRYQAFMQVCVCRAVVPDPTLNCWHATNIASSGGTGTVIATATVAIEDAVYNSWQVNTSAWRVRATADFTYTPPAPAGSHTFDVQVLDVGGQWRTFSDSRFISQSGPQDLFFDLIGADQLPPRTAQMRIVMAGAVTFNLATFNWCWAPLAAAPQPLPPEPSLPGLPTVPPPLCSTDDLCAIVQDLARQLTRVSAQVADLQASTGGTDVLVPISSQSISGEGELVAALGTRAVSVELLTLGSDAYTSALGRPRGLMRVGSLRWRVTDGYSPRVFIDGDRWVVPRPQGGLAVSWQLLPGSTGTLTWLG